MGRTPCCEKNGLKKGPWTPEEDQKLIDYIQKHGYGNWRTLPKSAGLQRCGKSCRLRWTNYLRPDIKRGRFSFEEEESIIQLHSILGNKWSAIAARLPGRTDNEIKNYWNTHIRKRLLRMGIDPVTHSPRLDLLDLSSILNSSIYNQSHLNVSRLLGIEPVVNPELLRLATSLLSSRNENPYNFLSQSVQQNQIQTQFQSTSQPSQFDHPSIHEEVSPCGPFENVEQYPSNFAHLGSDGNPNLNHWQMPSTLVQDSACLQDYVNYGLDQDFVNNPPLDNVPTSINNTVDSNYNFGSVMSPSNSSPAPLNSNSTYINSSTEDEIESYCNDILKFEIPDLLDVNDFL